MREIKFRGQTENKRWVYGEFVRTDIGFCITNFDSIDLDNCASSVESEFFGKITAIKVITDTVGQFINRVDINDKEAYVDDIIERWHEIASGIIHKIIGVVFYCERHLEYRIKYVKSETYTMQNDSTWIGHDFKIIGNIHDNPELIK